MDSYHKIQQIYKEEVKDIFDGHIIIEEKLDGSQFRIEINTNGEIKCGSRRIDDLGIDSMFKFATDQANHIFANYKPDVKMTVFCEYLAKPKQNSIPYARVPLNNLILFDVKRDTIYLDRPQKELFAKQHGMEIVPLLWEGEGSEIFDEEKGTINEAFKNELLKKQSILGHQKGFDKIEGFVIKNYNKLYDVNRFRQYQESTHPWMSAKIVNDEFKEKNKEENPNRSQNLQKLKDVYRTEARCQKAIQHLQEKGILKGELADLKHLVPEVIRDIEEEEKETIKEALWNLFGKEIVGYASKEMIPYYKKHLAENN